jgi:hypothetical protein
MDPQRFDTLVRAFSSPGTRRGLLRLLAAVPVAAGLLTLRESDLVQVRERTRGQDGRSRHGKRGRSRDHGRRRTICTAESRATTCKDTCGTVKNNCGKRVNCGNSCATGCCDGDTCQPGTTTDDCGQQGVACTSCTGGRVCFGNGVCGYGCVPGVAPVDPGFCLLCGNCAPNLSGGGPEGVCVTGLTCRADCASCAAHGQVCVETGSQCDPGLNTTCGTPC